MRLRKITFILIAVLLLLPFAPVQADAEITVLFDRYNPPYMYDDQGDARGLYPGIVTRVFELMGMTAKCKAVPWKRALDLSCQGQAAIGGLYKTAERECIYAYSEPLYTERLMVYVNENNMFDFKGLESLNDKNVGVLQGWSYGDGFDKARSANLFRTHSVNTDLKNFQILAESRTDCVIATRISATLVLKSGKFTAIRMLKTPLTINHTHIAFAKTPENKALVEQFNAALRKFKESGEYQKLLEEYGIGPQDAP